MTKALELPVHMRRDGIEPAAELAQVRDREGVVRDTTPFGVPAYLVCRYDDVRRVLSEPATFSSAVRAPLALPVPGADRIGEDESARLRAGNLLTTDPPEHTRLRRMLTPEFTVRRMRRLEPRIVEIVEAALDGVAWARKPADLVSHFTLPVPSLVISELLGVPYADRAEFQGRSARLLNTALPIDEQVATQRESFAYMATLVARAKQEPGEDMLGMLVREHGDDLSTDELIGIAALLLVAGHETTSSMLGLGTLALLRHPDQLNMIRDDPALVEPAVEELLRWLSILHSMPPRITTTEVEIAGHIIPENSVVLVSLPAANRDQAFIGHPETLDITRGAPGHVAFGHGVHHCLGAPLARMEMCIAFPALLRRFPHLALAQPYDEVPFRSYNVIFGLESLQVTW